MKKSGVFLLLFFTIAQTLLPVFALDLTKTQGLDAQDLSQRIQALARRAPDLVTYERLGKSLDQKPIEVVRLGGEKEEDTLHLLLEAGIHGREMAGPFFLVAMVEDYVEALEKGEDYEGVDLRALVSEVTLHFVVNSNPDGFDLARFGREKLWTEEGKKTLASVKDQDYAHFKANLAGVDLNRNFPAVVYHQERAEWVDTWGTGDVASEPGGSFYGGPEPASEVETRILMDYSLRYRFSALLSYHSMGRVLFYEVYGLYFDYHQRARDLVNRLSEVTRYQPVEGDGPGDYQSAGYFGHYFAYQTLKPAITIETLRFREGGYARSQDFTSEYHRIKTTPLVAGQWVLDQGFDRHKVYWRDQLLADMNDLDYARALKDRFGGWILSYPGPPKDIETLARQGWVAPQGVPVFVERLLVFQREGPFIFSSEKEKTQPPLRSDLWAHLAGDQWVAHFPFLRRDFFLLGS